MTVRERNIGKPRSDTWTTERPEPMELLARLAGDTAFRVEIGGGTPTLTTQDIAHALGCVKGDRAKVIALAIATRNKHAWPEVHRLSYGPLISQLLADRKTRHLVAGADKFRARLILYDAFHDLVAWRDANWKQGAVRYGMTQRDYKILYYAIVGFLRTDAIAAAHAAIKRKLFGRE
jgi:hypothetical protein